MKCKVESVKFKAKVGVDLEDIELASTITGICVIFLA